MKRSRQTEARLRAKAAFDGSLVFGTKVFNQVTGRDKQVDDLPARVTAFFIDPGTGTLQRHMAESRDCPVCGEREHKTLFVKDGFSHVKCRCEFIFVNPAAGEKYRDMFFEKYESWTDVLLTAEQESIDSRKFEYGLSFIERHSRSRGLVVDVGAGTGSFLRIARQAGWRVSAVEFNQKAVEAIRKTGVEVFDRPMSEGIYAAGSVDVVTLWEVLEHVNHPDELVKQSRNILRPGGLLFVCVPNIDALVTRILHEKSGTFEGSTHVNFFSIESLARLLEKQGFEPLEADTAISEMGTIQNYLCYEDPYLGESRLDLDFITPRYLYEHDLGSRIFMLARRKN